MTTISKDLPLEFLATWVGPSASETFLEMFRERLVNFHSGEEFETIPKAMLYKHLEIIEWAYSQGARPGHP
jgi:hypothetical protein